MGIQLSPFRNKEKNRQLVAPRRGSLVLTFVFTYIVQCKLCAFRCLLRNKEKNRQYSTEKRYTCVLTYIVQRKLWAFSCLLRNKDKNRQSVAPRRGRLRALLWSTKCLHCFHREYASYYTNVRVYIYTHLHRARIITIG